jgi:hypothetical protein
MRLAPQFVLWTNSKRLACITYTASEFCTACKSVIPSRSDTSHALTYIHSVACEPVAQAWGHTRDPDSVATCRGAPPGEPPLCHHAGCHPLVWCIVLLVSAGHKAPRTVTRTGFVTHLTHPVIQRFYSRVWACLTFNAVWWLYRYNLLYQYVTV